MLMSKEAVAVQGKSETLNINVHYVYHGLDRCGLIDINFTCNSNLLA